MCDFQALDQKFVLTQEPKVFKLEGLSFLIRPSICVLNAFFEPFAVYHCHLLHVFIIMLFYKNVFSMSQMAPPTGTEIGNITLEKQKNSKQSGADLGQAQLKLGFNFTLVF